MSAEAVDDDRPRDLDAERSVLGACMLTADAVAEAQNHLVADDFYRPAHATLFRLLCELFEAGHPTDPVSVAAVLDQRGKLMRVGGAPFLHQVYADTPTATNVGYWAEIVADRSARARLLDASLHLRQLTQSPDDTAEVQERAREVIETATTSRAIADGDDGAWLGDVIDEHIDAWSLPKGDSLPWPFVDLNEVTEGMEPGQLVIVAGRPGTGKSVLGTDCARHIAKLKIPKSTLLVSLEMSRRDVVDRIVAAEAKVRIADIKARTLNDFDKERVVKARERLRDMPIRIEDRFSTSLARLRAIGRDCKRSANGLDLLVVDYLQLLTPADPRLQRREQVDAFSRGLKSLAKELEVPVIAMAQLNREVEKRPDKRPAMSDLRESGSLEQDADMVILMNRPDAYQRDDPRAGEADLILAKHRNGPTATITIAHQLHFGRFSDIARG